MINYNFMQMLSLQQHNVIPNNNQRFLDLVFSNFDCIVERMEYPVIPEDAPSCVRN